MPTSVSSTSSICRIYLAATKNVASCLIKSCLYLFLCIQGVSCCPSTSSCLLRSDFDLWYDLRYMPGRIMAKLNSTYIIKFHLSAVWLPAVGYVHENHLLSFCALALFRKKSRLAEVLQEQCQEPVMDKQQFLSVIGPCTASQ